MLHTVSDCATSRLDGDVISLFGDDTIKALGTQDLAHLQMVNVATRDALADGEIWAACVKREMPQLAVNRILFEADWRHVVMRCYACLQRTSISPTCSIVIENVGDSKRLETYINNATRCAEKHLANGGNTAHVLVGSFGTTMQGASASFLFRGAGQPPPGGLPAGCLEIKFVLDDFFRVGAIYHVHPQAPAAGVVNWSSVAFTLNVRSVSSLLDLSVRAADLSMDGALRRAANAISIRRPVSVEAGEQPLLCVLTLMDGAPQALQHQVVQALQLDYANLR
eukprot:TRINITY_DN7742_c0_g1_i1.p1 TRINITY_DN7742_c0_g1~~TRINITY_DN7742_c0_g1_i1.p1  ORF type:complete len:281 (-),score=44.99 TRINITY_DN7742_c0_g1_i1:302-1144(-)